ncbi:MAG: four helix bundle protein [Candidatus Kaiserbacteria bacterium]|nr:four helix bundle protein [Candidatus Kaiserbacteria bacterium]
MQLPTNQKGTTQKKYDLEERALLFAKNVRIFIKKLPKNIQNNEDAKQLVRSSGAVGANYIEGNESLGQKDFTMRLRISRKEAKESAFWLALLDVGDAPSGEAERCRLKAEARELMLILTAIIKKVS